MICVHCNQEFAPKPKGYNARYCTNKCKRRSQIIRIRESRPESIRVRRMRSYQQTKAHPDRIERHRASNRNNRRKVREWLAAYKMEHGCADCGYREHPAALQLDHEGPKAVEIGEARSSIARLKAEIESGKCVVRCANCHSVRTWKQKQTGAIGPVCGD